MDRIPARMPSIPKRVAITAVANPASAPASAAIAVAVKGSQPASIRAAAVAAPSVNEPSTVRSGNCSTRKLRYTP